MYNLTFHLKCAEFEAIFSVSSSVSFTLLYAICYASPLFLRNVTSCWDGWILKMSRHISQVDLTVVFIFFCMLWLFSHKVEVFQKEVCT